KSDEFPRETHRKRQANPHQPRSAFRSKHQEQSAPKEVDPTDPTTRYASVSLDSSSRQFFIYHVDQNSGVNSSRYEVADALIDEMWPLDRGRVGRLRDLEQLRIRNRGGHRPASVRRREAISAAGDDEARYIDRR